MKNKIITPFIFLLFITLACRSTKPTNTVSIVDKNKEKLEQITFATHSSWRLETMGSEDSLIYVPDNVKVTLKFDENNKKITGTGGCNSYFAHYKLEDDKKITITPPGSTMMFCEGEKIKTEAAYLALLPTAETYAFLIDKLIILCNGNKRMVFIQENDSK